MKRLFIIFLLVVLIATTIAVTYFSYRTSQEEAYVPVSAIIEDSSIPEEEGVFERSEFALEYSRMPLDENHQRNLKEYYQNRAFYGAPPSVPHPVEEGRIGANDCLKCHQNGGYVDKFKAYTPVSPHPDKVSCLQCHVAQKSNSLFTATSYQRNQGPDIGHQALIGSPPIIPHQIQLRSNCLSCHAGPSAPKEIRTTHPNRVNCRQCHVVVDKKLTNIGNFERVNPHENE